MTGLCIHVQASEESPSCFFSVRETGRDGSWICNTNIYLTDFHYSFQIIRLRCILNADVLNFCNHLADWVHPFLLLNHLVGFHKIWHEGYASGIHPNFITSFIFYSPQQHYFFTVAPNVCGSFHFFDAWSFFCLHDFCKIFAPLD